MILVGSTNPNSLAPFQTTETRDGRSSAPRRNLENIQVVYSQMETLQGLLASDFMAFSDGNGDSIGIEPKTS